MFLKFKIFSVFVLRSMTYAFLCFTPVTALILYGWLQRYAVMHIDHISGETQMARPKMVKECWINLKTGCKALIIMAVYTLPPTAIWMIMWWSGWEISFSKSYEEFATAPITSILAVLYFAAIMPMALLAQIRAIYLKDWRRGFDFQILRGMLRFISWRMLALSLLYLIGHLGWNTGMKIIPIFAEDVFKMPVDQLFADQGRVFTYYYSVSLALIFGLCILKRFMARAYYTSLQPPLKSHLTASEQSIIDSKSKTHKKIPRLIWQTPIKFALFLSWVGFAFLTYFGQFMHHVWLHWINIPLLHLPWVSMPL